MRAPDIQYATLLQSIGEYRKKYYQNQLFKGGLSAIALLITLFLIVSTLEYFGQFNSVVRGFLLFGYLGIAAFVCLKWIITPILYLSGAVRPISDEEAARQIGAFFPGIGDKLLNTLQLGNQSQQQQSDLIEASIRQKSNQLLVVRFSEAINFRENNKYLKYAAYPIAALGVILMFKPTFLTTSSERLLKFNTTFNYAPFSFLVQNEQLKAFRNEDFTVKVKVEGSALPENVYMVSNGTRFKLNEEGAGNFSYTFKSLQKEVDFYLDGAGYQSQEYRIQLAERPGLLSFDVQLDYPVYLGKPSESLSNVGNLTVPEGTKVNWRFKTSSTQNLAVRFEDDSLMAKADQRGNNTFVYKKTLKKSAGYDVFLSNQEVPDGQGIGYFVNVIPDRHPELALENFQDTTLYNYLVIGGTISDDYGFTQLKVFYNVARAGDNKPESKNTFKSIPVAFNKQANNQSYYFQWYLDSLNLRPGDRLEYYAQVWDNDGVNGPKASRSRSLIFSVPDKDQIKREIQENVQETQTEIEKALSKAKELENDLKNLENKLKANNELDFQERKMTEEILKKREELMNQIRSLQEKNKIVNEKSQQYQQQSESVQKKMDELQKLMNELMQEESKKLYEELEKVLEQKQSERMSKLLERLRNKERNTEKELERTLNLFKRLQFEQKMESAIEDLKELAEEQEELAEQTEKNQTEKKDQSDKKNDKKDNPGREEETGNEAKDQNEQEKLIAEQEKIEEKFQEITDKLEDLEKMGEELDQKPDTQQNEQEKAKQNQKSSKENLKKKQNNKAAENQKQSGKSMRKIAESMESEMAAMQAQQMQEDMDSLRDILENLHTLSFEQEQLMKDFKGVNLSDPRFITLGQKQLKLQDDAKIVEDSLYALANRVTQIQSFITRELGNMKYYMDESVKNIKDRKLPLVASQQQSAMTSINNLALMLSDVFAQMQAAMAMAMMPGSGKPDGKGNSPGTMQQQLNKQMREMGQGRGEGQQGNLSEQLAKMAAQQAAIREMVRKMMEGQKGKAEGQELGKQLGQIMQEMENSETEIVNKRITQQLIERNEKITIRLLESEKAIREQDEDEERKGETGRQILRQPPAAFEEYIRNKSRQTELLRTVPPNFTPFYKKQTDSYFQTSSGDK